MDQVIEACKKFNLEIENNKHFQCFPDTPDGMDSFFSATLKFK